MKRAYKIYTLIILATLFLFVFSCKKDEEENKNQTTPTSITDVDGNVYQTVKIGTQVWMKENLKVTKFNDGTVIPFVSDSAAWTVLTSPGYCWQSNDVANKNIYGGLYNWYAVNTGKLAPTGWHIASDSEWTTLENYLISNGYNYDGTTSGNKYAKSLASNSGWTTDTTIGSVGNTDFPSKRNAVGFTGLPAGNRSYTGTFYYKEGGAFWWTTTEGDSIKAYYKFILYNKANVTTNNHFKKFGFTIRCIKD